jgi:hypothetical protein
MAKVTKTIVATGVSSGLVSLFVPASSLAILQVCYGHLMLTTSQGFEAIKQLLGQAQPYKIILGARNTKGTQAAYDALTYDRAANPVTVLPLELNDLRTVRTFAKEVLTKLDADPVDYLLLNAAINNGAEAPGPHGSKWCESYVVDHLCMLFTLAPAPRQFYYDSSADT